MNNSEKPKKGITTIGPKGINFRSRLEARWAEFFTELGIEWDYEPIDLDGYITDFIIRLTDDINNEILVEVKGITDFKKLIDYKDKIENSGWKSFYLIVGAKLWNLDDIIKYKKCKKLNNLFSCLYNKDIKRLVLGIFGLPSPNFVKDKVYNNNLDSHYNNNYRFIKYIGKNKDLYVLKDFKYENLHGFYEKDDIEYLLNKIKKMDVNEKISVELLNMKINFEWENSLCFMVPNDINKKIIKDNYILTFYIYLEYNFINLHLKNYDHLYKNSNNNIIEYNESIIDLWFSIQNKYQYKRKK
jgi:hypothetical protein